MTEPDLTPGDFRDIALEVDPPVAVITLDRPDKLNAFTTRMQHELIAAFDLTDADDRVRAVIVTGRGRGFCAGADLSGGGDTFARAGRLAVAPEGGAPADGGSVGGSGNGPAERNRPAEGHGALSETDLRDGGGQVALRIFESKKPVIAAINGPAVGVGITMTLPMDIRLASESARMGFVFARRGIVPEACSSWFLPRVVGISQACEWVMTGRVFDAAEALAGGLVRSVHPPDELLPAARALAEEMAAETAPVSVALARLMLWRMLGADHPMRAHRMDSRAMRARGGSDDSREGVTAFLEKRPARFPMRVSDGLPDVFPDWDPPGFS